MTADAQNPSKSAKGPGLRSRQKAKRRDEILRNALALFEDKGIEATTMAEIAAGAGVSPPTVFNYFGSKDGILIALITEGSKRSRDARFGLPPRTDDDFATILVDQLAEISRATLLIADKRVWRYAEAAAIRHPTTELAIGFADVDNALEGSLENFLRRYALSLRAGTEPDSAYLARVIFNVWNATYFDLIKYDDMTLASHTEEIRKRVVPLCGLLFTDAFNQNPTVNPGSSPHADS